MGSSQHAADPTTQAAASAGAQAQAQSAANLSNTYNTEQQQQYKSLFGTGGVSGGGTLSKMMDPNSLNVSQPTGAYALQYKQATGNLAQQTAQQRGALTAQLANQGFGTNSPSGMAQDADIQLGLGQNAQQGQLFTQAATNSYNDALNNFWNANNIAAGQAATSQSGALQGNATSAQTNTNLYNTASQPYAQQGIGGALLGAGAQAGSAAIMCTVEGTLILLPGGKWIAVEALRKGDNILGIDRKPCVLKADPKFRKTECVELETERGNKVSVSASHTFQLADGGYEYAPNSSGSRIKMLEGTEVVTNVTEIGEHIVYFLEIGGSHSYNAAGFWSLS